MQPSLRLGGRVGYSMGGCCCCIDGYTGWIHWVDILDGYSEWIHWMGGRVGYSMGGCCCCFCIALHTLESSDWMDILDGYAGWIHWRNTLNV